MYSYRIEQGIRAAAVLHQDHQRKGVAPYPYVTHPFSVSCIISDYTDDEDVIIAGLLHDTLEDTDYTPEELQDDFGPRVREIVEGVTEPPTHNPESGDAWMRGKAEYVRKLKNGKQEPLIVAAADKIHNMRSMIEEYHGNPQAFVRDFGGTFETRMRIYQDISNILNRNLKNDILHEFNHVFDEYKKFIEHAQKKK